MTPWARAITALRLLQVDPHGLKGIVLHARSGPVRDAFCRQLPQSCTRLHPAMTQDVLTGGVDVSASLSDGTLVMQRGLLDNSDTTFVLTMAERVPQLMASTLADSLDASRGNTIIALDEHSDDEEPATATLTDRLAFHVALEGIGLRDLKMPDLPQDTEIPVRAVIVPDAAVEELVSLAVALGIQSLRAPALTLNAARAHAALFGRNTVTEADVIAAAELVLAPRATQMPDVSPEQDELPDHPDTPPDHDTNEDAESRAPDVLPDALVLAAIQTALPAGLLTRSDSKQAKHGSGSGAGQRKVGNRRGRPLPPRDRGGKSSGARVDLVATLRAAIPWQKLRRAAQPDRTGPIIHPTDLRYKRFEDLSDRLLIFAVDASGSAALARLAEAKGAVELLLAEAYARRDHVALISFRGDGAEILLPPTRSLVQTKRRLAELPGGGGTPLAQGLKCSLETALMSSRKGLSPMIIVLTDGRSNIALDGSANRTQAAADAQFMARQIAQARIDSIVIDTSRRPEAALRELALSLRGHYVSLPRADARTMSSAISQTLEV